MGEEPDPLVLPALLKRDASNKAEFQMAESVSEVVEVESRPAKSVKAPVKAAGKLKVKAAGKAPIKAKTAPKATVKAAKAPAKAKEAKPVTVKDQFGLRKASTRSEAAAMYARKNGATLNEVKEKLGSVQLNVLVALEAEGYTVEREKIERKGERAITRYRLLPKA